MIVESAQMLCTVYGPGAPYKPTHRNHPCTLWVASSKANYDWLCAHAKAMCAEYTRRYHRRHKTEDVIDQMCNAQLTFPNHELTPFAQALPEQYRNEDAVVAYRKYYMQEKSSFAEWNHSNKPDWWV